MRSLWIGTSEKGGVPDKYIVFFMENDQLEEYIIFMAPGTENPTEKILRGLNIKKKQLVDIILKEIGYTL